VPRPTPTKLSANLEPPARTTGPERPNAVDRPPPAATNPRPATPTTSNRLDPAPRLEDAAACNPTGNANRLRPARATGRCTRPTTLPPAEDTGGPDTPTHTKQPTTAATTATPRNTPIRPQPAGSRQAITPTRNPRTHRPKKPAQQPLPPRSSNIERSAPTHATQGERREPLRAASRNLAAALAVRRGRLLPLEAELPPPRQCGCLAPTGAFPRIRLSEQVAPPADSTTEHLPLAAAAQRIGIVAKSA
jgi:hypothetical protein